MLRRMAEIVMDMAETLHAQLQAERAAPEPPPATAPDPVLRIGRLARALRQLVHLDAKIAEGAFAATSSRAAEQARRDTTDRRRRRADQRRETERLLEYTLRTIDDPRDLDDLYRDLNIRLDREDPEALLGSVRLAAILGDVAADLGVRRDVSHWTDDELGGWEEVDDTPPPPRPGSDPPGANGHDPP
jgi:hypothetical protein